MMKDVISEIIEFSQLSNHIVQPYHTIGRTDHGLWVIGLVPYWSYEKGALQCRCICIWQRGKLPAA